MAKKITPTEMKAELEAQKEAESFANPNMEAVVARRDSGMRRVCLVPPTAFPGIDVPDGLGGSVTITPQPRLVTVAVANALLRTARRAGNEFGLTEDKIRIEEE